MKSLNTLKIIVILFIIAMATGCAYTPQIIDINPTVEITPTNIGNGQLVSVYVVDERNSSEIGRRGSGMMRGAAITTGEDITTTFSNSIVKSLNIMGYQSTAVSSPSANQGRGLLRVDIRSIEYEMSQGFWTGGVHARGAMKATATRASRNYDQLYRVDDEKRVVIVPGANENSQMINATVSALLQEMFNDTALFEFLSE